MIQLKTKLKCGDGHAQQKRSEGYKGKYSLNHKCVSEVRFESECV